MTRSQSPGIFTGKAFRSRDSTTDFLITLIGLSFNSDYEKDYGTWTTPSGSIPVASTYRIAWRRMAATTGYRTLYPAIIPPGTAHADPVTSACSLSKNFETILFGAVASSFMTDFFIRASGVGDIRASVAEMLPLQISERLQNAVSTSFLRLNCLTSVYAPLWEEITGEPWTTGVPLRRARERQTAQNEIDAIVALSLGITADELCMIYRTQFPVMRRYDREDLYDAAGRKVPNSIRKSHEQNGLEEILSISQRTWVHPQSEKEYVYEYPFSHLDREKELREAYDRFRWSVL